MEDPDFKQQFQDSIDEYAGKNQFGVSLIPAHVHNGTDSLRINPSDLIGFPATAIITDADAANIYFNLNASRIHSVTLAGNRILNVQNAVAGQVFVTRIIQGSGGSHTVTWFSTIHWTGSVIPTLTTTAGHWDTFGFICTAPGVFDGYTIGLNLS